MSNLLNNAFKRLVLIAAMPLLAASVIATPAKAQEWPKRPITIMTPFDAGGSADRLARGFAQYMSKELGQPVIVTDRPGANGQVGSTWLLQQPDDGYNVMLTPASPFMIFNILVTGAKFTLDDFTFVNAQWTDYVVLITPKDRPYKTTAELVDAIRANPGKLSAATDFGSTGYVGTIAFLNAIGVGPNGARIVTFDGAGAMRSAVAGGQVDFSVQQGEGSMAIKEFVRPLAVFLDHRTEEFDAPLINDELAPYKASVPLLSGSVRTFVFPAGFKKKHPQDYATFVAAYRRTLANPEFQAFLKTNSMAGDWVGEEKTTEIMKTNFEALKEYKDLLKK